MTNSKSDAFAVFVRERGDTVFELDYLGRSRANAYRRQQDWATRGARVVGGELRCNASGNVTFKKMKRPVFK
jgi:hypothetical protein